MKRYENDILVIGSGIAGCVAALELADMGLGVSVITKVNSHSEKSNTWMAQGGIAWKGDSNDSPKLFYDDIIAAGDNHCYTKAVNQLVDEGPSLVEKLLIDKYQIKFDKNENGSYALNSEGHHSQARILHVADASGKTIEAALHKALEKHSNITLLQGFTAVDLLTPHHHSDNRLTIYEPRSCMGAYILDQKDDSIHSFFSKVTVLATGGLGSIFLRSTNPESALGDGVAMANRMGARTINMEFVQFHPTTFFANHSPRFLISEALRGAGARLVHKDGQPFMQDYDTEWKDLAARDVVSRSIHREMLAHNTENVYLDIASHMPSDDIKKKFPTIYNKALNYNIDISKDLIPVVPAAHYSCGGVWVDLNGRSTINNLYAVGEVACTGVHGANRLASTSLLEALVWGYKSAQAIKKNYHNFQEFNTASIPDWNIISGETPDPALIQQDLATIRQIMWNYVGLVRNHWRLDRAMRGLRNLEHETERFYRVSKVTNSLLSLRNAVRTAVLITGAAWENKGSMGCHFREN